MKTVVATEVVAVATEVAEEVATTVENLRFKIDKIEEITGEISKLDYKTGQIEENEFIIIDLIDEYRDIADGEEFPELDLKIEKLERIMEEEDDEDEGERQQ